MSGAPVSSSDQSEAVRLRTTLRASDESVSAARRYGRDVLVSRGVETTVVEQVELLISEAVTYALRRDRVTHDLLVLLRTDDIRVEVVGPGLRRGRRQPAAGPRGRSRTLLDVIAVHWGIDTEEKSGRLWFSVPRSDATPTLSQ